MTWTRLGFVAPLEGMHWGLDGSTVRPDEGFNQMADNYRAARSAYLNRHTPDGSHDDHLIARGVLILEWDEDLQAFEIERSDPVLYQISNSPTPGAVTVHSRIDISTAWCRAATRNAIASVEDLELTAAARVLTSRSLLLQTFRWRWDAATGAPSLVPAGCDVSLEVRV